MDPHGSTLDSIHVPLLEADFPYLPRFVTYPFFDHSTNMYFGIQPYLKVRVTSDFLRKETEFASDHFRSAQDFEKFHKIIKAKNTWGWESKRLFIFSLDYINGIISKVDDDRFEHLTTKDPEPGSMKWPILKDAESELDQSRDMCVDNDEKIQFFSIDDLVKPQPTKKVQPLGK